MERMGEVVRASEFYRPTEQSWLSWGANVVKRPVVWALKSYLPSSGGYEGEYILNSVAKVNTSPFWEGSSKGAFIPLGCFCPPNPDLIMVTIET